MDQAIDAMPDAGDAARSDVLEEKVRRVPGVRRLLRSEVTGLGARRLVEAIPAGSYRGGSHAQNVTLSYVLCKRLEGAHVVASVMPAARSLWSACGGLLRTLVVLS